jgi:hypothetical protein
VTFAPLEYLEHSDGLLLADKLRERTVDRPLIFERHPVLIGRGSVSPSLPVGTFAWSFATATGPLPSALERRALEQMMLAVQRSNRRRRFRLRDIIEHDGFIFLRRPALVSLSGQRDARASMIRAALGLLSMLEDHRELIRPPTKQRRLLVERARGERGPPWSAEEDAALRSVFAPGAPRASKRQWEWLLAVDLHAQRTRKAVLMRVERLGLRRRSRESPPGK